MKILKYRMYWCITKQHIGDLFFIELEKVKRT